MGASMTALTSDLFSLIIRNRSKRQNQFRSTFAPVSTGGYLHCGYEQTFSCSVARLTEKRLCRDDLRDCKCYDTAHIVFTIRNTTLRMLAFEPPHLY